MSAPDLFIGLTDETDKVFISASQKLQPDLILVKGHILHSGKHMAFVLTHMC